MKFWLSLSKKHRPLGRCDSPTYNNILHYAAYISSPEIFNLLLSVEDINVPNDKFKTALFIACDNNKPENADFLLANGAVFDITKVNGITIFKYLLTYCLNTLLTVSSLEDLHRYRYFLTAQKNIYQIHIEQIDKIILKHDLSNKLLKQTKSTKSTKI